MLDIPKNLYKRYNEHLLGDGAEWTKRHYPRSINMVTEYDTFDEAKKLETEVYYKMKKRYGSAKVRGAGNTKSY